MADMSENVAEAVPLKPESGPAKTPNVSEKTKEKKPAKKKPAKTTFSGRVEEITIGDGGAVQFVMKGKRDKHHSFSISAGASNLSSRIQLLTTALGTKFKLHVETETNTPNLVRSLALHAKK
jgi:hypothetical protein